MYSFAFVRISCCICVRILVFEQRECSRFAVCLLSSSSSSLSSLFQLLQSIVVLSSQTSCRQAEWDHARHSDDGNCIYFSYYIHYYIRLFEWSPSVSHDKLLQFLFPSRNTLIFSPLIQSWNLWCQKAFIRSINSRMIFCLILFCYFFTSPKIKFRVVIVGNMFRFINA